ncbi:hypothetical protein [Jannaschia aquimarina]|uniref:Uncharacterized protein n=1 Tax=Jannaschia aquimarina TaxID=935700 RepID=A0A0D1CK03_9RHOB|nr:hypothetical protein [Jannaschia aquimarina]KIT15077.1 hypothetical protein jaqu_34040 [Jannaschia aquimarina]SNS63460.1 hypothetical protein SAMN05421775_101730 [Jannaschia aquimarina]
MRALVLAATYVAGPASADLARTACKTALSDMRVSSGGPAGVRMTADRVTAALGGLHCDDASLVETMARKGYVPDVDGPAPDGRSARTVSFVPTDGALRLLWRGEPPLDPRCARGIDLHFNGDRFVVATPSSC